MIIFINNRIWVIWKWEVTPHHTFAPYSEWIRNDTFAHSRMLRKTLNHGFHIGLEIHVITIKIVA